MMALSSLVSCPAQMWRTVHHSLPSILLPCHSHWGSVWKRLSEDSIWRGWGIGLFLKGKFRSHLPLPVKFPERTDITASTSLASERERVFHTSFLVYLYVRLGCPRLLIIWPALVCSYITSKQSIVRIHGILFQPNVAQEASTHYLWGDCFEK